MQFTNEDSCSRQKKGEKWVDKLLEELKEHSEFQVNREKSYRLQMPKVSSNKASLKLFEKSSNLIGSFLKSVKKVKKEKKNMRSFYWNDFNDRTNDNEVSLDVFEGDLVTCNINSTGEVVLKILKGHLKNSNHCISRLIIEFLNLYQKVYGKILNSDRLKAIYDNTIRINNGELTIDNEEERYFQNDFSGDSNLVQLANKSFYDIKSIFDIIINIIPYYYSGLFSTKFFLGIKENLMNYLMNEYIREGTYDILFTFSRILTSSDEERLYQCIQKSNSRRDSDVRGDIDIVDYLYRQICPEFRVVQIERDGNSMVTSLCYMPSSKGSTKNSSKNISSNLSQLINIRLNYENASEKLIGLDYCQSPLEKIFMIKLVSESIKQDCQISREGQTKTLNICSDTLVDIFAYIVIL